MSIQELVDYCIENGISLDTQISDIRYWTRLNNYL